MHLEDFHTVGEVGKVYIYLAVKASGTHKCLVKDVGTVCGGEYYHTTVGAEAIHLGKQLVEGVLALVVGTHAGVFAAGTSHGIDFIDKDNTGGLFLGLTEEVAHSRGTYTHKHLYEVGTRHREERHIRFAGDSLGKESLTCSGRSY